MLPHHEVGDTHPAVHGVGIDEVDLAQAVRSKLARNALKYPARQTIARVSPARASEPGTHVLLDHESVQPSEDEPRSPVPDASQVWVFHGPHQRQVEERFASFGTNPTADQQDREERARLPSFYMGYIASRHQALSPAVKPAPA